MPDDLIAQSMRFFDVRPEQLLTPARERLASGLRELIEARLHLPISLATLCQEFGVSLRTAERAFGLRYEETMVGYIKRSRLDRARQLLLSGHSVTRAASDVGWTHLGRFSVEFRQRFGQSPSSLRKRSA
jgi:AraC-like DNA-binding protein